MLSCKDSEGAEVARVPALLLDCLPHIQIKLNKNLEVPEPKATLCDLGLVCSGLNASKKSFGCAFGNERHLLPLSYPYWSRKLYYT